MCSTNPGNWVTFDDDSAFQSSQKSKNFPLENQGACRPNGLKLNFSGPKEFPSSSSSTSGTPLSSPVVDFYLSPGPPSNSPLSTPTKDFPGFPGIPKAGAHVLYPIPESSSNSPLPIPGAGSGSLSPSKPACLSHASLPSDSSCIHSVPKMGLSNEISPHQSESLGFHGDAPHFQYFREDCSFSSPFWKDEGSASRFTCDHPGSRKTFSSGDKEMPIDQKSLNQGSLNYICEKLEHLQSAENQESLGNLSLQCLHAEDTASSFVPHLLFRSQPKAGWSFMLRIPEKKNMMSSRQWGPVFLKVLPGGILQMYYEKGLEKPFKELQLDPHCRLSDPKVENFSVAGKIHTVKIEHVSYTEKRKYHSKTDVVHEPDIEQMLKLGSTEYHDFLDFLTTVEEELLKLPAVSKQKRNYEEQEISLEIVDNFWGKITKEGKLVESAVITQISCLCFVNGNTECFLTLNDLELQKRDEHYFEKDPEKKGIDILVYHFHKCVKAQEFEQSRIIKFVPLDACRFELMRFKTLYNGEDLPFFMKSAVVVQGAYVELQAFVTMAPLAQRPSLRSCDNIMIHFPVPSQWIKALWTMNLQRQKSLKAKMNRRACLGSLHEPESEPVIQVSVGSAKYESAYRAVVWKIDRLPDKNSNLDHPHCLSYKLELGSDQEIPSDWYSFATVQFVMLDTCASKTEVRSLGMESDVQPQKRVHQRACYNIQPKLYRSVIEDVIDGVRDLFAEEGIEEQVLKDLKQLWETKVLQSKATEDFFRNTIHSPLFTLHLPHNLHQTLQTSTASLVIPGRTIPSLTTAELGTSNSSANYTFPSSIGYQIHIPAGATLQTASGHLYKISVPIMVTQTSGRASILQHPVQQIFHQLGQPSVIQTSVPQLNPSSVQSTTEKSQRLESVLQQPTILHSGIVDRKHLENTTTNILLPPENEYKIMSKALLSPQESSQYISLPGVVFASPVSQTDSNLESVLSVSASMTQNLHGGPFSMGPQGALHQHMSDVQLHVLKDRMYGCDSLKQPRNIDAPSSLPILEKDSNSQMDLRIQSTDDDINEIIQIDGTGDLYSKEEIGSTRDVDENEFLGIIDAEDLKVLEEEGDSLSNEDSTVNSSDNEDPQIDIVEEDPLNSGDDVSEQDVPDLFDTDNVIVCQYEKIHRSKNKWKFYLKDGVMCFGGRDYVFAKAIGDAEW
ncbi:LOW QUALITY PROTEIN: stonin-1 [Choloepus didactylus]|uniref:LOW QUALITY PROTEIN: stonin-1 n=1 Tax=Choloepus didactylus TaxID=27675 RepID=UPI0018A01426|nr:LOW QUALITY PROTEIN: stonin-1 [Choloepus didactylus]